ncbi:hypothetical protein ZEAMMB73_Zm00001d005983, partial [Zea mays]
RRQKPALLPQAATPHDAAAVPPERWLLRRWATRAACRRRPRSRRCSTAHRHGERQTRWSTTVGSARTARPCPCRGCPCTGPARGRRRRRRPCRRAGAPARGSRSSPRIVR